MPIQLTKAVKYLLIVSFVCFIVQQTSDQFFGTHLMGWFALVPAAWFPGGRVWQLFTYSFFHSDVMHLFFNLMMLAFIGSELEVVWGAVQFLKYYFFCATAAGLLYLLLELIFLKGEGVYIPMIGAAGGIYGLLMAYGLLFGERVLLFMMLFPMKAKHFIWVLAAVELLTTIYSGEKGVASVAQLGGMAAGLGYLWVRTHIILSKRRDRRKKSQDRMKNHRINHLKLIVNNEKDFDSTDNDSERDPKTWH